MILIPSSSPRRARGPWTRRFSFALAVSALLPAFLSAADTAPAAGKRPPAADAETMRILERFDAAQRDTKTLKARFTQEKKSPLLKGGGDVSRGTLHYEAPDRVFIHYDSPRAAYYLVDAGRLLVYFPALKAAQETKFANKTSYKRFLKIFGLGQAGEQLLKYFNVTRMDAGGVANTIALDMAPRRKRVEKHIEGVKIWLDEATHLPRRVEVTEGDGEFMRITIEKTERNADLGDVFRLDLPADVKVEVVKGIDLEGL